MEVAEGMKRGGREGRGWIERMGDRSGDRESYS